MYPWLNAVFQQLIARKEQNRLHHALLLQGPEGIGKADFARELAATILCAKASEMGACGQCQSCKLYLAGSHPDFHEVISDKQIGVDAIREAIKKLSGSAQLSGAKVLVIYAAHTMTESSANALLKTLEEPTSDTYLLLVSHKAEGLLPTIISRCERILMPPPNLQQSMNWIETQWQEPIDKDFVKLYAHAPLSLLVELLDDKTLSYVDFKQGLQALENQEINPSKLANDWQEHAEKVLKWIQYGLHQHVMSANSAFESLWPLQQECMSAVKRVRNPGVNKVLVLNQLLSDISSIKLRK